MPYGRPGTYVNEVLRREQTPVNSTTAIAAFVGRARRGPITPRRFNGWTEVTRAFGQFTGDASQDTLLQAIYDYFNNGGRTVVALRPVGVGADESRLTFNAPSPDGGTTPGSAALVLEAADPGAWGDELYVEVTGGSAPDRFTLTIRLVPAGTVITNQQVVERWSDLSLNPRDARNVLALLNNVQGGSAYVTARMPNGVTYYDGLTLAASTVPGGTPLAGGTDGANITDNALLNAVYLLDDVSEPFVLNVPGATSTALVTALADFADATRTRQDNAEPGRGNVFVVVDSPQGADADTVIGLADTYPNSDHLAVYYPRLVVADPASLVPGATKVVPAGPSVVGRYIATDAARGIFKAPAGVVDGALSGVAALENVSLRNPVLDRLNLANINAIRVIPNRGVTVFGARTRKRDYITRYVSARRTIIGVRANLIEALSFAPFENNDQYLWGTIENLCDKVLRDLFTVGGLKGNTPDEAYYVKCDSENNTTATIALGEVHVEVGLALQRPAEFVVLTIAQFEGGAAVSEQLAA